VSGIVLLDAVGVATLAQDARDRAASAAPEAAAVLTSFAHELDEIVEAAVLLDQHDHEIEHQLGWWQERVLELESSLTGHPGDDVDMVRELALYRGRISGAHTMRRHYTEQRNALVARQAQAETACAAGLAAL
jgi:hypothetical protein